jgi:alkylmercury lyase
MARTEFMFDGTAVYGWCASDALTFPIVLGRPGVVESRCAVTGQTIRVELTPTAVSRVDPGDAVVSKVRPRHKVANLRGDICGLGLFFSSRTAAADWLARTPEGQLNTVSDDFEIHRQIVQECGWPRQLK